MADRLDDKPHLMDKLDALKKEESPIRAWSWTGLLDDTRVEYEDHLDILIVREEWDERMVALLTNGENSPQQAPNVERL